MTAKKKAAKKKAAPRMAKAPEGHINVEVIKAYESFKVGDLLCVPVRRFKSLANRDHVKEVK